MMADLEDSLPLPPVSEDEQKEMVRWLEESQLFVGEDNDGQQAPQHVLLQQDVQQQIQQHVQACEAQGVTPQEALYTLMHQLQACNLPPDMEFFLLMFCSTILIMCGQSTLPTEISKRGWDLLSQLPKPEMPQMPQSNPPLQHGSDVT